MQQENESITEDKNEPFVIEGILSELHVGPGRENLLQQIDKHYKGKSALTGLGAIAGGMHGQVASSAMLAMYDGENTENFACMIDKQILCGTFGGASKLPMDKKIKAVVTKEGDVLRAHGIICESLGLVWVGYQWGWKAERAQNFKLAWWLFLSQFVIMLILSLTLAGYGTDDFWLALEISFVGGGAIMLLLAFWNGSTMRTLADPATEVFRMLGFAEPEKVNLNRYMYRWVYVKERMDSGESISQNSNIFCYQKAIDDGKVRMSMPANV